MKRKHFDKGFFQCDWTGMPLADNKTYLPLYRGTKWIKFGSYLNWNCVVAHALQLQKEGRMSRLSETLAKVREMAGYSVEAAPHFSQLPHFGGSMDYYEFTKICDTRVDSLKAVMILQSGEVKEVSMSPKDGDYLESIIETVSEPRVDEVVVAKKVNLGKDKQLVLMNNLQSTKDVNGRIGQLSKGIGVMLRGDVMVLVRKKACHGSKDHFVNFTEQDFIKRVMSTPKKNKQLYENNNSMTVAEFDQISAKIKRNFQELDNTLVDTTAVAPKKRVKKGK
jgi:hypothetical protein